VQPQSVKVQLVAKVLLKAIMQLPLPDFKACVHLLSEKLQVRSRKRRGRRH
jgi:hypothetical protein